jgi:hypothetical protein
LISLKIGESDRGSNRIVDIGPAQAPFALRVEAGKGDDLLEIRLEDVQPELTGILKLRLERWVERLVGRMLEELG